MRPVIDFLSGIISGFGSRDEGVTPSGLSVRTFARRRNDNPSITWIDVLSRFLLLIVCVAIGSAALLAATGLPWKSRKTAVLPEIQSAPEQSLDEILSVDPAAAKREWKYIVIHHSASVRGSAEIFNDWHRAKGWRSLGYHFVIGNGSDQGDGIIATGPRWYSQEAGAHANATEFNEHGIGICLVGNFDEQPPSPAQWSALRTMVARLCKTYDIPPANILGHNQVRRGGSTACPGRFLSLDKLREGL